MVVAEVVTVTVGGYSIVVVVADVVVEVDVYRNSSRSVHDFSG